MFSILRVVGVSALLMPLQSFAQTSGGQQFYGNSVTTGKNGCAAIGKNVLFPAEGSYTVNSDGTKNFSIKFLIQNATQKLPLQYLVAGFNSDGTTQAYDPQLFGTVQGLTGTSNNKIGVSFVLGLGDSTGPLELNAPIPGTTTVCTIDFSGVLYFSPD